jgi:pimeloyl-ACP methyl ester carboxylesterase
MKYILFLLLFTTAQNVSGQSLLTKSEQEIINLSKLKWQWMADKKADTLRKFFHDKSMFVHMGGSWGKTQELDVIKSGGIWYKQAEVYNASVNILGNTAILLNDIDLVAVVGGNEVVNPFMVTEVYVKKNGKWQMGSLTFSRLLRPVKMAGVKIPASNQLQIQKQGSFSAGGIVVKSDGVFDALKPWNVQQGGQTRHGNHADVFYQVPVSAKRNAMIFLHGYGQSRRSWQTTADGREGFANMFLRNNYSIYLVDQPGRGAAGQTTTPVQIAATPDDQTWFTQFRIGLYPNFNEGVQFPKDSMSMNNFFRMMTPNTGAANEETIVNAMSAVFDSCGGGILFTHSAGGTPGWKTAIKNDKVKAVIAIEPGGFVFPEGETPADNRGGKGVPLEEFKKLTKIPIVVYFGDYIPKEETQASSLNFWRNVLATARQWAKVVNAHGGDATIVYLPDAGIKGNTHFVMSDLNNAEIVAVITKWLKEKGLDK